MLVGNLVQFLNGVFFLAFALFVCWSGMKISTLITSWLGVVCHMATSPTVGGGGDLIHFIIHNSPHEADCQWLSMHLHVSSWAHLLSEFALASVSSASQPMLVGRSCVLGVVWWRSRG